MTSNELNEILNKTRRTPNISLTPEQVLEVLKDLEVLDALKRNVGIRLAIQEWAEKETKVFPNDRKIVRKWLENDI